MNICIPRTIAMTIAVAATASGFEIKLAGESASEPGALPARTVLLTNPSAEPIKVDLAISVQRNPQNRDYISNGQSSDAAPPVVGEPVLAADRHDPARGWGFEGKDGARDFSSHWIADPLRKDRVRLQVGGAFRFRVEAGRYRVRLLAEALGDAVNVSLRGAEPLHVWTVGKPGGDFDAELALPSGDLWLDADGWVELQGLSLIEME